MELFEKDVFLQKMYIANFDTDYAQFIEFADTLILNESFNIGTIQIPSNLKEAFDLIKQLANLLKSKTQDIINFLKDKRVFNFFKLFNFSLTTIFNAFKIFHTFLHTISEKIAKSQLAKKGQDGLKQIDIWIEEFMNSPNVRNELKFIVKRGIGIGVASLLLYIWFQMSFTGDAKYDFDLTGAIEAALNGNYKLADIFAGEEGIKLLTLFATGAFFGLTFPWPGPTTIKFAGSILYTLAKKYGFTDMAKELLQKIKGS